MSKFTTPTATVPENDETVRNWLASQLTEARPTLLAFDEDGVIWGKLVNQQLVTAPNAPELRGQTLQQAFVFGKEDEVRLFRDEMGSWKALLVTDAGEVIVESQILWGDDNEKDQSALPNFLCVKDNRKGVPNQYLPVDRLLGNDECVRLEVHHLVDFDDDPVNGTGEARIALSRLAGISIGKRDVEVAK